jgi:NAD(P) transhydrogenase
MLDFCDPEIVESLKFHLVTTPCLSVSVRRSPSVESSGRGTITTLASGKKIAAEVVMHSAGRQGNTANLRLDLAGLTNRQAGTARRQLELSDRGAAYLRGR